MSMTEVGIRPPFWAHSSYTTSVTSLHHDCGNKSRAISGGFMSVFFSNFHPHPS